MNSMAPHDYIVAANIILDKEEERATALLDPSTKPKMLATILKVILTDVAKTLADSQMAGFKSMFRNDRKDQLADV
jgi:hypothetical protein